MDWSIVGLLLSGLFWAGFVIFNFQYRLAFHVYNRLLCRISAGPLFMVFNGFDLFIAGLYILPLLFRIHLPLINVIV